MTFAKTNLDAGSFDSNDPELSQVEEISALKQKIDVLEQYNADLLLREHALHGELSQKKISLAEAESRGKAYELLLHEQKQGETRFLELFSLAPVAYASICDAGIIENINLAGTSILRYPSSKLRNTAFSDYLEESDKSLFLDHLDKVSASSLSLKCNVRLKCSDGSIKPVMLATTAVRARQSVGLSYQVMLIDIAHQIETESRLRKAKDYLEKLAHHDPLTDLPNRMMFSDELHSAIAQSHRQNEKLALLFFDLDGFKPVNDTLGHQAGDKVLCVIAERLRAHIGSNAKVARLGGDEFTLILKDPVNAEEAVAYAHSVAKIIREPMVFEDNDIQVSSSIGVSLYPEHARTAEELIQGADAAMYRAKKSGRGLVELCSKESTVEAARQSTIETTLLKGIQEEQFELHYQPIYVTNSLTIKSVEALIRWHHPELGMVAPKEFIQLAEKSQHIVELGKWILDAACKQARRWRNEGLHAPIAINVSTRELLQSGFDTAVSASLQRYQLPCECLEFEITESAIMSDQDGCAKTLQKLQDAGHKISIDDFGTGYSSLARLAHLPVSRLKIDRMFINDLDSSEQAQAIVKSIIVMAHELGLEVISEGIEQQKQLEFLETNGCDAAQGFMMSQPMRPEAVTQLMRLDQEKFNVSYPNLKQSDQVQIVS